MIPYINKKFSKVLSDIKKKKRVIFIPKAHTTCCVSC